MTSAVSPPSPRATTPALSCRIITAFQELETLFADWNRLWKAAPRPEVFQSPGWARAWMRAFGGGLQIRTAVLYHGAEAVAILPLIESDGTLRFIGHTTSDYNDILCEPEFAVEALVLALDELARLGGWRRLMLENIREDAPLARAMATLPPRWQSLMQPLPPSSCPTLILEEGKEQLLNAILQKDKVKKTRKTILRLGEVTFSELTSAPDVLKYLPDLAAQHIARCVLDDRVSQFLREDYMAFYRYMIGELCADQLLRFCVLEVGGKPAAYHLGFEVAGRFLFYKPTFDIDLWDYSAGQVLLFRLLESFLTSPTREFDLGQGDETYKNRYANAVRQNLTSVVYAPGLSGRVQRASGHLLQRAKAWGREAVNRNARLKSLHQRVTRGTSAEATLPGRILGSRVYQLPAGTAGVDTGFERKTLRQLAEHVAHSTIGFNTGDMHLIRERLRKGGALYADAQWQSIVLAVSTAAAETREGAVELGAPGFVFSVLACGEGDRSKLFAALSGIAAERGLPGWLVSDAVEAGLTPHPGVQQEQA